jgi:lysozyme family protein
MSIASLITANAERWAKCEITPSKLSQVNEIAKNIVGCKSIYQQIEEHTGVPWWFIGIVHYREADLNFSRSIAQGDPWDRVSTHVPRHRGPFKSFVAAAIDALVNCPPHAAHWKDWSVGGALTLWEEYNGLGYSMYHHEASPYVWAATNQEQRGKYESDGHWDAGAWDTQLGCVALLKAIMEIDTSVEFGGNK